MSLVNQTLPGLYNGVSQQASELRLDTQVSEMINCHPTVSSGTLKRMPTQWVSEDDSIPTDSFIHVYDRGAGDEQYILVIKNGYWRAYGATTGTPVLGMAWQADSYLNTNGYAANTSFSMVTVGDTTYIVNKNVDTAMSSTVDQNGDSDWDSTFFYWVKRTTEIRFGTNNANAKGYTYYIYNASGTIVGQFEGSDGVAAATNLKTDIGGTSQGTVVKKTGATGYSGSDSWGSQASASWVGKVSKMQDLPKDLGYPGSVIEISGDDKSNFDNYYVKFEGGVYKETFRPGMQNSFNNSTMPHQITRNANGSFSMAQVAWEDRKVGDTDNAPTPSFIGHHIEDVFFYKNRLGFLSGDNVIMSETGEYYNFWPTTVTDVLDSDPIDVAVDSNFAVHLNYAIPFNKELLVFGDKAQFILSASKALSPKDVNIQQSTAYSINNNVAPITIGPNVYFATDTETSSLIREYYVVPDTANNSAANITGHCPTYVPNGLTKLTGSDRHDMLFGITGNDNKIYVYNYYWQGEEKAQSAWHTWELSDTVFNIEVLGSQLLIMLDNGSTKQLLTIALENDISVDYRDEYGEDVAANYRAEIKLSEFGFKTGSSNIDDKRGKLILKNLQMNVEYGSFYGVSALKYNIPKTYSYSTSGGVFPSFNLLPSQELLPGVTTYTMNSDHKYPISGDVKNLEVTLFNEIGGGFRFNSLNYTATYKVDSKGV